MTEQNQLMVKVVMKNAHAFDLLTDPETVSEMVSHPKFLKMNDTKNDIFVSIDDVSAFEILTYRKPEIDEAPVPQSTEA